MHLCKQKYVYNIYTFMHTSARLLADLKICFDNLVTNEKSIYNKEN